MNRGWKRMALLLAATILTFTGTVVCTKAETPECCAELILRAVCRCDGDTPEDGSLTFILWDGQYNILQMVVNLRQHAAFAPLRFDAPGRYVYYISQDGGGDLAIAYDPVHYQIVVEVMEEGTGLTARVAQVNRVGGDCVGEAKITDELGADAVALFENRTREVPLWAEVPETGDDTLWEVLICLLSGGVLFLLGAQGRKYGK